MTNNSTSGTVATQLTLDRQDIALTVAKEHGEGSRLHGKGIGDVSQSFSLFIAALGIDWKATSKAKRKDLSHRFDSIRGDYLASLKVAVTVDGAECELTRAGKLRLIGSDSVGLPTHARQTLTVERVASMAEREAELERREAANKRARTHLAAQKAAAGQ